MTPEEQAIEALKPVAMNFACHVLTVQAVSDAIAAAERAAYGRARQVALDYWADRIADHGCPSSAGNAVMNVADAILALDKPTPK